MTLITERYDYKTISRANVNGRRMYTCPDGNTVASVTTILDSTKDKTFLKEWRKRVGEKTAAMITKEASGIGTRMHKFLEDYIVTGEWKDPGSNPYSQQASKMAKIVKEKGLKFVDEIWGSEINLYHPRIYAGTTDLIGTMNGEPANMDFKQTNKPKKKEYIEDYFLQLVAYAEAHNEVYGTKIREGHVFMCSRDLQYQQFDIWPHEYDEWRNEWYNRVYQFYEQQA